MALDRHGPQGEVGKVPPEHLVVGPVVEAKSPCVVEVRAGKRLVLEVDLGWVLDLLEWMQLD